MKRKFFFTEHALDEIDNDDLELGDIMEIAANGETIEEYGNDKPYPSFLNLGWVNKVIKYPVHVVAARDTEDRIHIIQHINQVPSDGMRPLKSERNEMYSM